MNSILRVVLLITACLGVLVPPTSAKGKVEPYPTRGFPELTKEDRDLKEVPFAKGVPAVILLEAEQDEWEELFRIRVHYFRRVKILTEAGVREQSDFRYELRGDWRIKSVEARTVLPDGTEVDAGDQVFRQSSKDSGYQEIRIAYPRVEVGAILDCHVELAVDSISVDPWTFQQTLPVLKSELLLMPPVGLKFRKAILAFPADRIKEEVSSARGRKAFSFVATDVAAIPGSPNRPPLSEIAGRLVIIVDSYRDEYQYIPVAADWKSFIERQSKNLDDWAKDRSGDAVTLAKSVTQGATSPEAKAEAIRKALRERVRMDYFSDGYQHDSADEVLKAGVDTSGGIARTAVTMLRAVGVQADAAFIRRRSSGAVPAEIPMPSLYDDMLVRIRTSSGPVFFSPVSDQSVGSLPWDCRGILAVVLDGKGEQPEPIPDFTAAENRTARETEAKLSPDGGLSGTTLWTFSGVAAERWRRALRDEDAEAREDRIRRAMRTWMPGLELASFEIDGLDDDRKPLTLRTTWETEGYATRAGSRMLINPNLFSRFTADAWPDIERHVPVDLEYAYEEKDTLTLSFPEGTKAMEFPTDSNMNAGPVGQFQTRFTRGEGRLTVERDMRLDIFRFPRESYKGLRRWFVDIAAADDEVVAIVLPS